MAGKYEIKCVGPSYHLLDRKSAVQRAVNLYMRQVEGVGEDRQIVLDSAPGLETYLALAADARGSYNADGRWFFVAGNTLYEVVSGAPVARGTLASGSGYVGMKHGENQLVIVDGPNGYVLSLASNAFAQITDPDFRGSNFVDELDGYFIFVAPDTEQFYISAIDDGSDFDALDFSSADRQPDRIVTHRVRKSELFLFGSLTTEVRINSGDTDFPFVRYNSTPIDIGIVGPWAVAIAADSMVWVGQTDRGRGYVYEMQGHQPVRISTQAIEEALNTSTDLSQAKTWTYHTEGNEFVGINAPGLETTWCFDFSTRQWHERGELVGGQWQPLRTEFVTHVDGTHYALAGSTVYRQGKDVYALGADALVRERTWPHLVAPSMEPIVYSSLEIGCTTGHGGNITLESSNDGGYTWTAPRARSLGAVGRWMERIRWMLLGAARDRVFRLRTADAVPLTIHSAAVDAGSAS